MSKITKKSVNALMDVYKNHKTNVVLTLTDPDNGDAVLMEILIKNEMSVDEQSVSKVITQQQKMASMQKELVQQMEKYKQAASDVGLTLKGATQNSFKSAIDANDFKAAKES